MNQLFQLGVGFVHLCSGIQIIQRNGCVFPVCGHHRLSYGIELLQNVDVCLRVLFGQLRGELLLASLGKWLVSVALVFVRQRLPYDLSAESGYSHYSGLYSSAIASALRFESELPRLNRAAASTIALSFLVFPKRFRHILALGLYPLDCSKPPEAY